ncbi:MAG: hypothetical protein ACXWZS_10345 [Gemmatirosa sp.]
MTTIRLLPRTRLAACLLTAAALLPLGRLHAQTCTGVASFNTHPVRVGGILATGNDQATLGADLLFGQPAGPFGGVGVTLDDFDGIDESATTVQGTLGYQVPIGTPTRRRAPVAEFCPIATLGDRLGPDQRISGVDFEDRTLLATAGFSVGAPVGLSSTVNLVPFGGLRLIYDRLKSSRDDSDVERTVTDSYGALDLGAGLTFNDRFTARPAVTIPIGLEGVDSRFSLLFALHFGGPR